MNGDKTWTTALGSKETHMGQMDTNRASAYTVHEHNS